MKASEKRFEKAIANMKLQPKYRTPDNYQMSTPEQFTKPSITVPNMSLTIPEILLRYSQGQPVNMSTAANLTYTGEHFIPNMSTMDIIEQQTLLKLHREKTEKLTQTYNEKMKARDQRQQQEKQEKKDFKDFMDNIDNNERLDFYEYMKKRNKQRDDTTKQKIIEIDKLKPQTT